tara:strand:+ start:171 stop:611 length:441 start_codon:yes stop_codon:yes gene_type:complete
MPEAVMRAPSKQICLVRHGQAHHNQRNNPLALGFIYYLFQRDADLTPKGNVQAQSIRHQLRAEQFDLVVISPLTRTIRTAIHIFGDGTAHDAPKMMLSPLLCERCSFPADFGTPASQVKNRRKKRERSATCRFIYPHSDTHSYTDP